MSNVDGKTCDLVIDADTGAKCGKPAAQEFVTMPIAGLPERSAFLCADHTREFMRRAASGSPMSIGGR